MWLHRCVREPYNLRDSRRRLAAAAYLPEGDAQENPSSQDRQVLPTCRPAQLGLPRRGHCRIHSCKNSDHRTCTSEAVAKIVSKYVTLLCRHLSVLDGVLWRTREWTTKNVHQISSRNFLYNFFLINFFSKHSLCDCPPPGVLHSLFTNKWQYKCHVFIIIMHLWFNFCRSYGVNCRGD